MLRGSSGVCFVKITFKIVIYITKKARTERSVRIFFCKILFGGDGTQFSRTGLFSEGSALLQVLPRGEAGLERHPALRLVY